MLQYNYTVPIHLGSKLSRIVSIDRSFCRFVSFLFCFRDDSLRGVVFLFPINNTIFTQNVREKNISARPCGRTQKIHRQEAYCPLSILYIRHEINWYHALCPGTAPLNATRPCPRKSAPDPLGRGQKWILGRNTPLLCVIVTVNTTLSGGGQPPSPRKSQGLLGLCRLRPVCLSVSKGEQYIAFPTDTRFQTLEPHIPGRLPTLGPALNVGYLQLVICRASGKITS